MTADTLAWITGASSGLGRALCETAPFPRARLMDISRSGGTPGVEHVAADLTDPAAWGALEAHFRVQLAAFTGTRAVLIHNAATLEPIGFAAEVDPSAYRGQVLLNAAAPQALGQAFLVALHESGFAGEAHCVLLTSGAASSPYEGWSAYCAGKAAVDMWVRTVGAELDARGSSCRVLAVAPGVVDTAMQQRIRDTDAADFPRVARFRELHESGALTPPDAAARGLWDLLERDLPNGGVVDLRGRGA